MTTEHDTRLPLDEEIDAIIAANEADDPEQLAAAVLEVGDAQRFTWGMGRALKRLRRKYDDLGEEAVKVNAEFDHARQKLLPNITFLEDRLEEQVLERRESGAGNSFDIPGVGHWSTQQVKARWEIVDPKVVMEGLGADERAQFVENTPKLKGAEYRKYLDETGEVVDGVERRPERISVTYKLSEGAE